MSHSHRHHHLGHHAGIHRDKVIRRWKIALMLVVGIGIAFFFVCLSLQR